MAQAYRVRKAARRPKPRQGSATKTLAVRLDGCYCMEQKITVEWEKEFALDEFDRLLAAILVEPRSFRQIQTYVSGMVKESDRDLPPGKISKYRVSAPSLRDALDILCKAGILRAVEGRNDAARKIVPTWSLVSRPKT